jgi:hypothetical protein
MRYTILNLIEISFIIYIMNFPREELSMMNFINNTKYFKSFNHLKCKIPNKILNLSLGEYIINILLCVR